MQVRFDARLDAMTCFRHMTIFHATPVSPLSAPDTTVFPPLPVPSGLETLEIGKVRKGNGKIRFKYLSC